VNEGGFNSSVNLDSLFNKSVEENVRFAKWSATMDEIQDACKKAEIHEDILLLPQVLMQLNTSSILLSTINAHLLVPNRATIQLLETMGCQ